MMDNAPVARAPFFLVRMKPCVIADNPRYGIVATKKTFRFAVERNRAKRLVRDWVVHNEKLMRPDMDYVFVARRPILDASREDGRNAMARALTMIGKDSCAKDAE